MTGAQIFPKLEFPIMESVLIFGNALLESVCMTLVGLSKIKTKLKSASDRNLLACWAAEVQRAVWKTFDEVERQYPFANRAKGNLFAFSLSETLVINARVVLSARVVVIE